jgi:hypothetical protein
MTSGFILKEFVDGDCRFVGFGMYGSLFGALQRIRVVFYARDLLELVAELSDVGNLSTDDCLHRLLISDCIFYRGWVDPKNEVSADRM